MDKLIAERESVLQRVDGIHAKLNYLHRVLSLVVVLVKNGNTETEGDAGCKPAICFHAFIQF